MDPIFYKILHLIGISALALGVGGMLANGNNRKIFAICQGVGLLVMLVSGFGLLAKLQLGFPPFAILKTVLWVIIALLPMLVRKLKLPVAAAIGISLCLVGVMAWLGVTKPALW